MHDLPVHAQKYFVMIIIGVKYCAIYSAFYSIGMYMYIHVPHVQVYRTLMLILIIAPCVLTFAPWTCGTFLLLTGANTLHLYTYVVIVHAAT